MKKILGMVMVMIFIATFVSANEVCFDFKTTLLQRVITAYCDIYDYESNGNGLTQAKFAKKMMIHEMRDKTEKWEDRRDRDAVPSNLLREPDPNNPGEYLEIE